MYRSVGEDTPLFTEPLQYRDAAVDPTTLKSVTTAAAGPTPEQIHAFAAALPCGQGLPNEGGAPCLDINWIKSIGGCKFGLPAPDGVSAGTWAAFCGHMKQCALDTVPGCPSLDAFLGAQSPACVDDKTTQALAYCDQYPLGDGPNVLLNSLCWAFGKAPTVMYNLHAAPPCSGASQAGMSPGLKWGLIGAAVLGAGYLLTRRR
jgi:hypothetical protein